MKNYGLILEKQHKGSDDFFGGVSRSVGRSVLNESGQWDEYLPAVELQRKYGLETMACVSFSALNVIETLHKFHFQEEPNYSDRFLAKMSGTTIRGNTFANVANCLRKCGSVPEEEWAFDFGTWEEYYATIPGILKTRGEALVEQYDIKYEYVMSNNDVKEALKYSPLHVGVYAWNAPVDGIYPNSANRSNHAVMLYGYKEGEYWKIYDHYLNEKKKLAWDYNFGVVLKYSLELKNKPMLKLDNNTLVQEIEDSGQFGLYLDDKLYVDDLDKIITSFIQRNNGDIVDKTRSVKKADWDSVPKYNLKNEAL